MSFKKNLVLIFALLAMHGASAQTLDQIFDFAQATYPQLFSGTPTSGTYLQYTYRYYPTTKNYLAVDNTNVISLLGPASGNVILAVGPVSAFAPAINTWVAQQTPSGGLATTVATLCPTQTGTTYSGCKGGSNTMVTVLDPVFKNSFKDLTGAITSSTQPGISVGSACTLAIETYFGIFVAKFAGTTNTQLSFSAKVTDAITLSASGAVEKIYVTDPSKGQSVEVRLQHGGAEYTSWTSSSQSAVCKVK